MKNPLYCETCGYINVLYKEEKCPICECKTSVSTQYVKYNNGELSTKKLIGLFSCVKRLH